MAGKAGVEVLLQQLKIDYQKEDLVTITSLLRSIFSPDTGINDIAQSFSQLDEEEITRLSNKVREIRQEARMLMPTIARQKEWRKKTHDIVRKAIQYFYGEK